MTDPVGLEAAKPNPALRSLSILVGRWRTSGTHPLIPDTAFHGRTTFEWVAGGAFLMMRSEIDEPEIPSAIAIFGWDDALGQGHLLYFDERNVSRRYAFTCEGSECRWWREDPGFSQRMVLTISTDGRSMVGRGAMSRDDAPWEPDLALTYTRLD